MQLPNLLSLAKRLLIACILTVSIIACQSNKSTGKNDVSIEDFITDDVIFDDINQVKKIFYSLPSPLETALIMKSAGAKYDEELLNKVNNAENYRTNKSKALNLGIYTTDLSFTCLFEQTQASINYMEAAKVIAEGLDIVDAIDNKTLQKLEDNLEDRNAVMDIISETFFNSSSYLKEHERQDVAAIVLVGGFIEGIYLASKLVGDAPIEDNKLVDRILEQKLSFNIVQRMLEDNKKKLNSEELNEDVVELINELQKLKEAYEKVTVETSKPVVGAEEEGVAKINSTTKVSVEPEDFKVLQATIEEIRTSFIQ